MYGLGGLGEQLAIDRRVGMRPPEVGNVGLVPDLDTDRLRVALGDLGGESGVVIEVLRRGRQ